MDFPVILEDQQRQVNTYYSWESLQAESLNQIYPKYSLPSLSLLVKVEELEKMMLEKPASFFQSRKTEKFVKSSNPNGLEKAFSFELNAMNIAKLCSNTKIVVRMQQEYALFGNGDNSKFKDSEALDSLIRNAEIKATEFKIDPSNIIIY